MNVDVGPNITSMLERLAAQIGTTVDKVFPWYVQQSYLDGLITLIVLAVVLVLSMLVTVYGVAKGKWSCGDPANHAAVLSIVGVASIVVSVIGTIAAGPSSVTKILNPQYHAMQMLTRDVGNMVGK